MKNKAVLTITSEGYKVEVTLDGQRYVRRMRKMREGVYTEVVSKRPDIILLGEIDEALLDEAEDLLTGAMGMSTLLADFEEMDE